MKQRKLMKITDNDGLIQEGKKLFKVHHYGAGHNILYEEVNPEEYDKRIAQLAQRIMEYPTVNLMDIVKDALYDLPLKLLDRLEDKLNKEQERAKTIGDTPSVSTKTANRGTCVDLVIGKTKRERFVLNLRE